MKATMRKLAPVFNTNRMVREYAERYYLPAMDRWRKLTADDLAGAKALAEWKGRLVHQFDQVRVESVHDDMDGGPRVGQPVRIEATVVLGPVSTDDVTVQLYHGLLNSDSQLERGQIVEMAPAGEADGAGRVRYLADMPLQRTGLSGYTVRILPHHPDMPDARNMGLIRWA